MFVCNVHTYKLCTLHIVSFLFSSKPHKNVRLSFLYAHLALCLTVSNLNIISFILKCLLSHSFCEDSVFFVCAYTHTFALSTVSWALCHKCVCEWVYVHIFDCVYLCTMYTDVLNLFAFLLHFISIFLFFLAFIYFYALQTFSVSLCCCCCCFILEKDKKKAAKRLQNSIVFFHWDFMGTNIVNM